MIAASVASNTKDVYGAAFNRFMQWHSERQHSRHIPWYHPGWLFVYLTHLFVQRKGLSTALAVSAGFSMERLIIGKPRVSKMPQFESILSQILKAFRKQHQLSSIPLPDLQILHRLLLGDVIVLEILLTILAYWTGLVLALRSKEVFLLRREYFVMSPTFKGCYELRWPSNLMGNGIKAGPVRVVHPFQIPMMTLFSKFPVNPFLCLAKGDRMNTYLQKLLGVTARSMRHCGAYLILNEEKTLTAVANGLGHSSLICSAYYLDPWFPLVDHSHITKSLIDKLLNRIRT